METIKLNFELRNSFDEVGGIFIILNEMTLTKNAKSITVNCFEYSEKNGLSGHYLSIDVHRCRTTFSSLELKRDLNDSTKHFKSQLLELRKIKETKKNYLPFFKVDSSCKFVDIFFLEDYSSFENFYNENTSIFSKSKNFIADSDKKEYLNFEEYLALDFKTRKPFNELDDIFEISNIMLSKKACLYLAVQTPCSGCQKARKSNETNCNRCESYAYLTFHFYYEHIKRSSLNITISLKGKFDINSFFKLQNSLTKFALACSNLNDKQIILSCKKDNSSKIQEITATLRTNMNSEEKKYMDKLLKSISPE